jgi:hypothetical protein
VTITLPCARLGKRCEGSAMGMPRAANRTLAVMPAAVAAARIRLPTPTQKHVARRFGMPLKSAAVDVASRARIAGLSHHRVQVAQKKVAQLPPFRTTLVAPDPEDATSTTLERDERMARLCSKKPTTPGCGSPCAERAEKLVGSALGDRSRPDVPAVVGSDSAGVSARTLLHRRARGIRSGDPRGAAHHCGERDGRNGPCGAVEQHPAKATGPGCRP